MPRPEKTYGYGSTEEKTKPSKSDLMHLLHTLQIIRVNGFDSGTVNQLIDLYIANTSNEHPLKALHSMVRILYDGVASEIAERLLEQGGAEVGDVPPNMHQPKYKVGVLAEIAGCARQTVNNWTMNQGGYLRSFKLKGSAKFILEEDLIKKFTEVCGFPPKIDENFRKKYEYKIKA